MSTLTPEERRTIFGDGEEWSTAYYKEISPEDLEEELERIRERGDRLAKIREQTHSLESIDGTGAANFILNRIRKETEEKERAKFLKKTGGLPFSRGVLLTFTLSTEFHDWTEQQLLEQVLRVLNLKDLMPWKKSIAIEHCKNGQVHAHAACLYRKVGTAGLSEKKFNKHWGKGQPKNFKSYGHIDVTEMNVKNNPKAVEGCLEYITKESGAIKIDEISKEFGMDIVI